jgi:AraC family ethanolamine operon transcriptional activator
MDGNPSHHFFKAVSCMEHCVYILTPKLHAARIDFKNGSSDPGISVSDIAMLYNMSHFGRFSMQYKKMFGELPSSTLKQAKSSC